MRRPLCLLAGISLLLSGNFTHAAEDAPKLHEIKRIAVGGDGGWDYLTCDSANHRLFIARSTRVTVVDLEKGSVAGEISNTPGVHGIALAPRLKRGFTSNGRENTVTIFDTDTLKELDRVKVGTNPDCIIFDRASSRVFTFNGGSNDATAINAETGKVEGTIALGGRPEYAVADRKGMVYVNIEDKSEIVAIDAKALTVKTRWSLAPGDEPSGLAMDTKNRRLFSVCSNEKMVVSDPDAGKVVATPTIGKGPDAAGFDTQEGLAYSSNGQDGTLTLIKEESPDKFTVVGTVSTERGARTMAVDTRAHTVILVTAKFGPAPAPAADGQRRRPSIEPNSFVVLVYGK